MRDAETYLGFAEDCRRLAAKAGDKDKVVLLKIAEAWEHAAKAADMQTQRVDGSDRGSDGGA